MARNEFTAGIGEVLIILILVDKHEYDRYLGHCFFLLLIAIAQHSVVAT